MTLFRPFYFIIFLLVISCVTYLTSTFSKVQELYQLQLDSARLYTDMDVLLNARFNKYALDDSQQISAETYQNHIQEWQQFIQQVNEYFSPDEIESFKTNVKDLHHHFEILLVLHQRIRQMKDSFLDDLEELNASPISSEINAQLFYFVDKLLLYSATMTIDQLDFPALKAELNQTQQSWQLSDKHRLKVEHLLSLSGTYVKLMKDRELQIKYNQHIIDSFEFEYIQHRLYREQAFKDGLIYVLISVLVMFITSLFAYYFHLKNKLLSRCLAQEHSIESLKLNFINKISHEVRMPLHSAIGFNTLLSGTELSDPQRTYSNHIHTACQQVLRLFSDMLDLAQLQSNTLDIDSKPINLEEFIEELAEGISHIPNPKKLAVVLDQIKPLPSHFIGEKRRVKQVLLELVRNAIKFTAKGSVLIQAVSDEQKQQVTFTVTDTGKGIIRKKLVTVEDLIDEQAQQEHANPLGAGIGLRICKGLLDLMDAHLTFKSHGDTGTSFSFSLPGEHQKPKEVQPTFAHLPIAIMIHEPATKQSLMNILNDLQAQVEQIHINIDSLPENHILICDPTSFSRVPESFHSHCLILGEPTEPVSIDIPILVPPITKLGLFHTLEHVYDSFKALDKAKRDLNQANILVVDDNPLNRILARDMLTRLNAHVELAESGEECIRKVKQLDIDLVLLDIHMPYMDGYETSKLLRQTKNMHELPIIAFTANACIKENYQAHEMNTYIAKPASMETLYRVILNTLDMESSIPEEAEINDIDSQAAEEATELPEASPSVNEQIEPESEEPILDLETLNSRIGHSQEMLKLTSSMFCDQHKQDLEKIADLIASQQWEDARKTAHSLKGVCANLAAQRLYTEIAELEKRLKGGEKEFDLGPITLTHQLTLEAMQKLANESHSTA